LETYNKGTVVVASESSIYRLRLLGCEVTTRRIFRYYKVGVTGVWRKLHTNDIYIFLPNNVRGIKLRGMEAQHVVVHVWAGEKCIQNFSLGTSSEEVTWETNT
jgi:hypothetical protein